MTTRGLPSHTRCQRSCLIKMCHCHKNLTFRAPVALWSVVRPILHPLFLQPPPPAEGKGRTDGLSPSGLGPCHCSGLSLVYEGTTLIDFPLSFAVKQMAWPWFPLGGRPCHNRCSFARISPPPCPASPRPELHEWKKPQGLNTLTRTLCTAASVPSSGTEANCKMTNTYTN